MRARALVTVTVAVLCVAVFIPADADTPVASICEGELTLTTTDRTGYTPHTVGVTVGARADCNSQSLVCALIDYGDGAQDSECHQCLDCDYATNPNTVALQGEHTYICPGTYALSASAVAGCADCPQRNYDVVVRPAELVIYAWYNSKFGCGFAARRGVDLPHVKRSTVDWGDGHVQEFTWVDQGSYGMIGPSHGYLVVDLYTIKVTNEMEGPGGCTWIQTAETELQLGLAVETSTWGKVKALYR